MRRREVVRVSSFEEIAGCSPVAPLGAGPIVVRRREPEVSG
jgi:hypothetical protein